MLKPQKLIYFFKLQTINIFNSSLIYFFAIFTFNLKTQIRFRILNKKFHQMLNPTFQLQKYIPIIFYLITSIDAKLSLFHFEHPCKLYIT
jgi:hypothetical protein